MALGHKTGGRSRGVPNKRTSAQAVAARLLAAGQSPLEFLTGVYRDATVGLELRVEAARAAAPYVHPRRLAIANDADQPLTVQIVRFADAGDAGDHAPQ